MKKFISRLTGDGNTILSSISELSQTAYEACKEMDRAVDIFCDGNEDIKEQVEKIKRKEMAADKIIDKISRGLYSGRFLPFSSEDWFELIHQIDKQADLSERIGRLMTIKKIRIPKNIRMEVMLLSEKVMHISKAVNKSVSLLSVDLDDAKESVKNIAGMRENVREMEYVIFNMVFSSKMKANDVILLKEIIYYLAQIANVGETIGNRIKAMAVKYSF